MIGIIDLGSNTARMNIYDVKEGKPQLLFSEKKTIGLAAYIDENKVLTKDGLEKAITVLNKFKKLSARFEPLELHAIATASLRNATNANEALQLINKATGLQMKILTGEEEALADFYGVQLAIPFEAGVVLDIGGGSTELVVYANQQIQFAKALPMGSLSSYMKHVKRVLPTKKEMKTIRHEFIDLLKELSLNVPDDLMIYGIGGSIRAARKLYNHIHDYEATNTRLTRDQIKHVVDLLVENKKATQVDLIRIVPERVHTLLPGLSILQAVMKYYDLNEVTVSNYGVREGYLMQQVSS